LDAGHQRASFARGALEKFWAPVPWMLEGAILLEISLDKYVEASIIAGPLVFNAALILRRYRDQHMRMVSIDRARVDRHLNGPRIFPE